MCRNTDLSLMPSATGRKTVWQDQRDATACHAEDKLYTGTLQTRQPDNVPVFLPNPKEGFHLLRRRNGLLTGKLQHEVL